MRNILNISIISILSMVFAFGCTPEKKSKDRRQANDMFNRICKLTREYTEKLSESPDSSAWADECAEFEEKLDKISFGYPPDTDLLLTEGQNDTIQSLLLEYIKARDGRIHDILHPKVELDTLVNADSVVTETISEVNQADASHNPGN